MRQANKTYEVFIPYNLVSGSLIFEAYFSKDNV